MDVQWFLHYRQRYVSIVGAQLKEIHVKHVWAVVVALLTEM